MQLNSGVYQILCKENGHRYIGSSKNLKRRLGKHRSTLGRNKSPHPILQNAWNKHGGDDFEFSVLFFCDESNLLLYEQIVIDAFKPKYNARPTANSPKGMKVSEQTKSKLREINLGKRHTTETREKNRKASLELWATPETREMMVRARQNVTDETRQKLRTAKLNRPKEETDRIIRKLIGRPVSEETREKLRKINIGKFVSPETREKLSISSTGKIISLETRERMSQAQKERWKKVREEKSS
jgi:group I intron endonuclease